VRIDLHEGSGPADFELALQGLLKHVAREEVPDSQDLLAAAALEVDLRVRNEPDLSVIAVGDIMLGSRAKQVVALQGPDYPFAAVLPLLRRAPVVLGNLEGPFARTARRVRRNHSYRVDPALAGALSRAGINIVTLANNHLVDCGRAGVLETLEALEQAGVAAVGAGRDERAAHGPVIRVAGGWRIGVLGYYWNRRCAARADRPGSAMDPPEALAADISALRQQVDYVLVTFHWGVPYERQPSTEDQAKARWAVDCGADLVIGHHPHIVQRAELYRGCPIFYSVGNFAFGTGNSRAEGLLVGVRLAERETTVEAYPVYVKNRDPRVCYQPKLLRGAGAERALRHLVELSGWSRDTLESEPARLRLRLPRPAGRRGGDG
jgi:poly-gamma-glutamate capsule biosynthesis protein CapA/YwtB (metallophosphatase superfamily)